MTRMYQVALAAIVAAALAAPAWAQQSITQADIQRLQDNTYLAERDITSLRSRDAARAGQLQTQLDDLKDEVIYLKVKLRKDGSLARSEYSDVRDRIDDVRSRATTTNASSGSFGGGSTGTTAGAGTRGAGTGTRTLPRGAVEIPTGTEVDVRLQTALNSGTAQVEDRFEAATLVDVTANGVVAIPAGSLMRGVISSVEPATRTNRTAKMTVSFDQVTVNGRDYQIHGTVTQAIEGEGIRGDVGKAGAGAAVGGILGAVLGGAKGAVLGAVIGGGGTIAATEGKEINLPQGTTLRVRIDSPVQVQTAR
jgi:hypothetical protein